MERGTYDSPLSVQQRLVNLGSLLLSSVLGVLGIVLLFCIPSNGIGASESQDTQTLGGSAFSGLDFTVALVAQTTSTASISKTVEPPDPDTGEIVSICFTISGLSPEGLDVVLAHDVSRSMDDPAGTGMTRLEACQAAASTIVDSLPTAARTGLVTYSNAAQLAVPLTTTRSTITGTLNSLTATGYTNIGEAISVSHEALITSPQYLSATTKVIILLSDGIATCDETRYCNSSDPDTLQRAADYARTQATLAASDTIRIYTIGFGDDADEVLLQDLADITGGRHFFAPDGDVLEAIYLTIALELHSLLVTDILTPGVQADCSQWPAGWCVGNSSGVTTITWPIDDSALVSDPVKICFAATANLDPNYEGLVNLPGSGISYQGPDGEAVFQESENPPIAVGGRKIRGNVFHDWDENGSQGPGEAGIPGIVVSTSTGLFATTNTSGTYVIRTSDEPALSLTIEVPSGYVATTPTTAHVPVLTGIYTVHFGARREPIYLPLIVKNYPCP